jgi:hypothetical protein
MYCDFGQDSDVKFSVRLFVGESPLCSVFFFRRISVRGIRPEADGFNSSPSRYLDLPNGLL